MTRVTIIDGLRRTTIVKVFSFRFQARTWLLVNGYLFDAEGYKTFEHVNNGTLAVLESRGVK